MRKDQGIFVSHVIESIGFIQEDIQNVSWDDFRASRQLQDIVIRRIEIIGEAVKNLSPDVKDRYPDVPWKRIAGMRDILIHGYFGGGPRPCLEGRGRRARAIEVQAPGDKTGIGGWSRGRRMSTNGSGVIPSGHRYP